MNKEQQELIDEVYEKYSIIAGMSTQVITITKEEFIYYIKTDPEFSKTWELKIEERELNTDERMKILINKGTGWNMIEFINRGHEYMNEENIATRLITITYNDKKIESYE